MRQFVCQSYLLELAQAIHNWNTDTFKLALYNDAAAMSSSIGAYTAVNEIAGAGYVAGGVALALTAGFPKIGTSGAWLADFADVLINPATLVGVRYGLIYNSSKANRACFGLDFGFDYSCQNTFAITWPPNDDSNCLIQLRG